MKSVRLAKILLTWVLAWVVAIPAASAATAQFLRPDEAFKATASATEEGLTVTWRIAPKYYLYKKRFAVKAVSPGLALGAMQIPKGDVIEDEYFGKSEVYRDSVQITVPLTAALAAGTYTIEVKSQGCADAGLCYPPESRPLEVTWRNAVTPAGANQGSAVDQDKVNKLSTLLGVTPASQGQASPGQSSAARDGDALQALAQFGNAVGLNAGQPEFLDPDAAFMLDTRLRDGAVEARWTIAETYYLYRNKFAFEVIDGAGTVIGAAEMLPGKPKYDEYFGDVEVYYQDAVARIPVLSRPAGDELRLRVTYQGCADAGLCYPPIKKTVAHAIPASFTFSVASQTDPVVAVAVGGSGAGGGSGGTGDVSGAGPTGGGTNLAASTVVSEQDRLTSILADGSLWLIVLTFFGGGLLLSLTPCVFPMIPILSSIIVGQGENISKRRSFALSFVYVQGMALTYTVVGIVAGLTGANLQIIFQDPWVLSSFALVFVLLALSMFGFYELQLPASLQARLVNASNRQRSGSYTGVATMGVLSALIVGPCVAPPLFGALAYISTTGDGVLGGVALYALSMGLGVPLLAVGVSAGTLLPRAGAWMDAVKRVFGVLLLAVAVFFLERILPGWLVMLMWAALLIIAAIYMGALDQLQAAASGWQRLWKGSGLIMLTYGVLLMVGASSGNTDPFQPLGNLRAGIGTGVAAGPAKLDFRWVKGVKGLDDALRTAAAEGRPVMLDYYADWCISCKEMDKFTFSNPAVIAALNGVILLKTDVTADDAADKALMGRFKLFGPPTIQFFGPDGRERTAFRVVGFMNAERFKSHVEQALSI